MYESTEGAAPSEHAPEIMQGEQPLRLTVAIITRQRVECLEKALDSVMKVEAPEHTRLRILVVDNDEHMSSCRAVMSAQQVCRHTIKYVVEPRPGIPQARNRAVVESGGEDFIVFVDDDETIGAPDWLKALLTCQRRFGADVVQGPVLPEYVEDPPTWILRGGFFAAPDLPSGWEKASAASGNTLVMRSLFSCMDRWFDERFPFLGKTDNEFFSRAAASGAKIVWCRDASVYEAIPAYRCTGRWLVKRAYKIGNAPATMRRFGVYNEEMPSWAIGRKKLLFVIALSRGAVGTVSSLVKLLMCGIRLDRAGVVKEVMNIGGAAGRVLGASGIGFDYYKTE